MVQLLLLVILGGLIVFVVMQAGVVARAGTTLRSSAVGRGLAVLIIGIVLGVAVNRIYSRERSGGKELYLKKEAARFDKYVDKPHPVVPDAVVGLLVVGGSVGAYELVVLGISSLFPGPKRQGAA